MKLQITTQQAHRLIQALEGAVNPDYSDSDEFNAGYIRLKNKILKEIYANTRESREE